MSPQTGEVQGSVTIRPWRVGIILDPTSAEQVRYAIERLSVVWGGVYTPLLDHREGVARIRQRARYFDVDSLFTDADDEAIRALTSEPGFSWRGGGQWGPFRGVEGIRTGLLRMDRLSGVPPHSTPRWSNDDPFDAIYGALYGRPEDRDITNPKDALFNYPWTSAAMRTAGHISLQPRGRDLGVGLMVARAGMVEDAVTYWNARALGVDVLPLPDDPDLAAHFLSFAAQRFKNQAAAGGEEPIDLPVWHVQPLTDAMQALLDEHASQVGGRLHLIPSDVIFDTSWFPGAATQMKSTFRSTFEPGARSYSIRLPSVPLQFDPSIVLQGVVAAEVEAYTDSNQDPRFSSTPPPFRRHTSLIQSAVMGWGAEQVRVASSGAVFGVHADTDELAIPFLSNLEIFRVLFNDERLSFSQSDEGKFQTRAAEILGGMFSGVANRPGMRAALMRVAERSRGVTRQEIESIYRKSIGEWPDPLMGPGLEQFVEREMILLLNSGILVPLLDVQCSHCRVVNHAHPSSLDATLLCEFCGERFNLALSLQLTKPHWRYRLAAHLPPERIEALFPALAAFSLLSSLRFSEAPRMSYVAGLEVSSGKSKMEVDVAAILGQRDQIVVLGEVKNGNRIDEIDVAHLENLQARLDNLAHCVLMFLTLKPQFGPEEQALLRAHVERQVRIATLDFGRQHPVFPLVLTGPDVSLPWYHDEHPWRWGKAGDGLGIFGTALESCKRNLGLLSWEYDKTDRDKITLEWQPA